MEKMKISKNNRIPTPTPINIPTIAFQLPLLTSATGGGAEKFL